ncbi:BLI-3 blue-light-inducible Bli-3 protein [Gnomoniopsis sp. IMI 355080]|nr:BLI-3 blue-light-inducible Bli-3 protein [Gnomoniopsis sp. IMI 355080]
MSSSRLLPVGRRCLNRISWAPELHVARSSRAATSRQPHKLHCFQTLITCRKMSFSNTSGTGDKPADPYTAANADPAASLDDKVNTLSSFVDACKFGMMTTRDAASGKLVSRCMAVAAKENGGIDLLFHTNTESNKTDEVQGDEHVNISFLNGSGEWASLSGAATVETDRELVRKHYSPILKTWLGDLGDGKHDGSENDPRIGVIRVKTTSVTYAVVAKNILSRAVEVAQGAVTGKPAEINKIREISESEVGQWRSSH